MVKLTRNAWLLIAIHAVHSTIEMFLNTFLIAYFLNLTDNNIIPTSWFYIFTYAVLIGGFIVTGPFVKCGGKLAAYRLSFVINAIVLLLIIYLKENITQYIWVLGVILGIEKVLFYYPQNLLTSEIAKNKQLIKYNGYRTAISGLTKIIMPTILGWLISIDSYVNTAIFILALTAVEFLLSYSFQKISSTNRSFKFKAMLALAFKRDKIRLSLGIDFIKGFIFDIIDVLVVLYVIYMFKTNLNLGIFTSVFSICTVTINIIFGRFCNYRQFGTILTICSLCTFGAASWFVFDTTKLSFIFYNFAFTGAAKLIQTITDINMYKVSQDKSVASLYRAEYLSVRELFLNIGRVLGFLLVIAAAASNNPQMLKYLILSLSFMIVIMGYFSTILSRKLSIKAGGKC